MEIGNLFITASKCSYRYPHHGWITTEDLWCLKTVALDEIYKELKTRLRNCGDEDSLLGATNDAEIIELNNKIEIVKYIVNTKLEVAKRNEEAKINAEKRRIIMELIKEKEDSALRDMSPDDLRKMLEDLK